MGDKAREGEGEEAGSNGMSKQLSTNFYTTIIPAIQVAGPRADLVRKCIIAERSYEGVELEVFAKDAVQGPLKRTTMRFGYSIIAKGVVGSETEVEVSDEPYGVRGEKVEAPPVQEMPEQEMQEMTVEI